MLVSYVEYSSSISLKRRIEELIVKKFEFEVEVDYL